MDILEIVNLGAKGVKSTPNAIDEYKKLFRGAFGRLPECPSCGTTVGLNDWKAFEALSEGMEIKEIKTKYFNMSKADLEKTFVVYNSHDLVTYVDVRNGRSFVERSYINSMSESFAVKFLESAESEEELLKRKKYFAVLPEKFRLTPEQIEADELLKDIDEEITEDGSDDITDGSDDITDDKDEEITEDEKPEIIENETGIVKNDLPTEKTPEQIKAEKNAKRREAYRKNKES